MASKIDTFLVFDGTPQQNEAAPPLIFCSKTFSDESRHFAENQAGIFLTLIKFAKFFTNEATVDYTLTDKHEIAIMELQDNIWLSISKLNNGSPNRQLLLAILKSCKRLYQLFFKKPERDPKTGHVTRKSAKMMKSSFEQILLAISHTNLTFVHLFDSYFQLQPPKDVQSEIEQIVSYIKAKGAPIQNIAIMHSRNFLYSNFPIDVTQTLAFALQMKFPYLFPRVLMKDEVHLYWIIGLSRSEDGPINVYAPPILYNNESYPFVGLKYKKYKIFLSLKSNIVPTPEILNKIPPTIKPLKALFNKLNIETKKGKIQDPFIVIESYPTMRKLSLVNQKISDAQIPAAETDIIRGHTYAHILTGNNITVSYTGSAGYFMYFNIADGYEHVILTKTDAFNISRSLRAAQNLLNSTKINHIQIWKK